MTEAEVIEWFESLVHRGERLPFRAGAIVIGRAPENARDPETASAWVTEVQAALEMTFPPGHVTRERWVATIGSTQRTFVDFMLKPALGIVQTALGLLKEGRLRSILDGARAETVGEVLDQADSLLRAGHVLAATVLAGGALETHLLHLCQRNGLTWVGDGSISKYDQAIAQARNAGTVEVYSATDTKLVTGWGGIRNDATHEPTKFSRSPAEVRLMVEGIRQFVARVP